MLIACIAVLAFGATLVGGLFALRLRDSLHLVLGFSAGAVVAVAFFDLLPEALALGEPAHDVSTVISFVALGFMLYLLLDRLLLLHAHAHEEHEHAGMHSHIRAGSLSAHSFLDGIGIGLAFQASPAVGSIVAVAVLAHDFSDGINTVSVVVRHGGSFTKALRWLLIDALAPVAGIAVTLLCSVSASTLGLLLALFAGFFLYIGASDLIPESHHAHPTFWTTALTVVGAGFMFAVIQLARI